MSKKKTHEEFIKEVYNLVGEEYTVLGKYINCKEKILIRHNCDECGNHEFYITPDSFINKGSRCHKCGIEKVASQKRKTHEQFLTEAKQILGDDYEILGVYINNKTKIQVRHKICNTIYETTPDNILRGHGCVNSKCKNKKISTKLRKLHSKFLADVQTRFGDEFEILEEYKGATTPIKIKHKACGHTRLVTPSSFLKNSIGCDKCAIQYRSQQSIVDFDIFLSQLTDIYGDELYVYEDTYKGMSKKVKIKHMINNKIFYTTPYLLLKGHLYKEYGIKKRADAQRWTTEEFKNKVYSLVQDEYTVLGKYTGANNKILMKHNKCNYEYEVTPSKFINVGRRCPRCRESKGEKAISQFLDKLHINYQPQFSFEDCRNKEPLPFDFAIFDNDDNIMCLIEYQGEHHYEIVEHFGGKEKFQIQQKRDEIKRQYCRLNNIKLVEIPYWEFDNIEKILNKELHIV